MTGETYSDFLVGNCNVWMQLYYMRINTKSINTPKKREVDCIGNVGLFSCVRNPYLVLLASMSNMTPCILKNVIVEIP